MVAVPTADGLIDTENAPVELNAGTVTVAGTVAMEVLLLASETVAPPVGGSGGERQRGGGARGAGLDGGGTQADRVERAARLRWWRAVTVMVAVRVTPL